MHKFRSAGAGLLLAAGITPQVHGWDYEGHRMVNQIALAALPQDFPSFVRIPAVAERIAYLSGEPDRWRAVGDIPLKHAASPNHYMDMEYVGMAGLDLKTLSDMRHVFITQFAAGRAAHAAAFPSFDPAQNTDHTREWPGFAPWEITEYYGKLKAAFTALKSAESAGKPDDIANARANVADVMGLMGHYVGDCSQPLHLTMHFNGWVGENPKGYTTWSGFHAWIDGGFIAVAGITAEKLVPRAGTAKEWELPVDPQKRDPMFVKVVGYLEAQHAFMEPLYQLEKAGELREEAATKSTAGREFLENRLLTGGQTLAAIWVTAWKNSPAPSPPRPKLRPPPN